MAFSKIILNGTTLMDVTNLTAGAGQVLSGYTSIDNAGEGVNGSVGTGTVTAPSSITGTEATVSAGTNTLTLSKTISVTPNVTTAGYISSGTAGNSNVSLTASVNTRSSSDLTASGATVTAPAGYYSSQATKTISSGTEGTPTATKGTVSNHSVSVTPSVTNTAGYISGSTKTGTAVTVAASELVSGSETKTENGTYDVTNLASLVVSVSGGGASNIVQGTFTTGATRNTTSTVSISYSGSGYPIALFVYVDGGAYNNGTGGNTTWYNSTSRYDVGWVGMVKSRVPTTPTYATSGADNYGTIAVIYKNSTSTATSYTRTSSMTANTYTSSSTNPGNSTTCVRLKGNGTTLAYYVGNAGSSYIGLAPSTKYAYIVIYSS